MGRGTESTGYSTATALCVQAGLGLLYYCPGDASPISSAAISYRFFVIYCTLVYMYVIILSCSAFYGILLE